MMVVIAWQRPCRVIFFIFFSADFMRAATKFCVLNIGYEDSRAVW